MKKDTGIENDRFLKGVCWLGKVSLTGVSTILLIMGSRRSFEFVQYLFTGFLQ